jgi:hypothetical protein
MEVASPLTFGSAGAKRHYPGSPGFVDPNRSFAMMDASATNGGEPANEFMQPRAFKRRRFTMSDDSAMESDNAENSQNHAFPMHAMSSRGPFSTPGTLPLVPMVIHSSFRVSLQFSRFVGQLCWPAIKCVFC